MACRTGISLLSGPLAGHEGVPVHLVDTGLLLALGTAEGIDGVADANFREPAVLEHLLPARTGHATGNSAGPEVDVPQGFGRHGPSVGDVGELKHAAWSKRAPDVGEHGLLVRTQVDHPVGDD